MSRKTLLMATVVLLLAGAWVCARLWSEPPAPPGRPADTDLRPPPPGKGPPPDEVRQWLRQMSPVQKRALFKELLVAMREDLAESHRRAAEQRFRQADTDGDDKLTFEEAWKAGVFRPGPRGGEDRGGPGAARGPRARELRRERSRPGGKPRQMEEPSAPGSHLSEAQFPISELEQQLLESWDLLQELDVLSRDAGER